MEFGLLFTCCPRALFWEMESNRLLLLANPKSNDRKRPGEALRVHGTDWTTISGAFVIERQTPYLFYEGKMDPIFI